LPPSSIQQLPIFDIIADAQKEGANIGQAIMYDRFSADGKPRSFDASSDLSALFPVKARFLKAIGGADHKGVLVKGLIQPAANFHNWKGQIVHSEVLEIAHYKWTDRIIDRVRSDYRVTSEARIPCAVEYKRVLDRYERHGRFAWEEFAGALAQAPTDRTSNPLPVSVKIADESQKQPVAEQTRPRQTLSLTPDADSQGFCSAFVLLVTVASKSGLSKNGDRAFRKPSSIFQTSSGFDAATSSFSPKSFFKL